MPACRSFHMRNIRFTLLSVVLVSLLFFLQYRLWFESGGMMHLLHLKKELVEETQKNDRLKARNSVLLKQIEILQQNNAAIESRARADLGMIKKGETFYQVVK